jgi:hypothetical protein
MALTATDRGTGSNNSSSTSMTFAPSSNMTAGALGVLCIALDNAGASGSTAAAPTSFIDAKGNTWTRRQDAIFDPGAASAGVELAIYTATLTAALLTSDTSTINWASAVSVGAKAWTLREITAGANKFASYVSGGVNTGATTGTPTVTTGSITSGDCVIGAGGAESADTWAGDADTTNGSWSTHQHTGVGSGNSGMSVTSQAKVVNATGTQTYNPTLTSADCILAWIQVTELNAYTLAIGQGSFTLTGNAVTLTRSSANHVLDSATDTDGTNANAHTPEEGGPLSKPGTFQNACDVFIYNNQFTKDGVADAVIYYYAAEPGLNCSAGGRFKMMTSLAVNLSIVLRLQTGSDNYYFARHNQSDQKFSIRKSTNSTPSTIGDVSYTLNAGDTADVEFFAVDVGGVAHLWLRVNGVEILRVTDNSPHPAGKSGFRFSGAMSSTTGYALQNFFSYAAYLTEPAAGSFTLTGNAVTLTHGYVLAAGVGSLSLTGNALSLQATRKLPAAVGSFVESGQNVALRVGRTMAVNHGSFAATGNPTSLLIGRKLSAVAGVFTETGRNVSLLFRRRDSSSFGSFTLNGIAVSLRSDRKLGASAGSFVETGFDVGLLYQPVGHSVINVGTGFLALTGTASNLLRSHIINASHGIFAETGQGVSLLWNRRLAASAGIFLEAGFAQSLLRGRVPQLGAGSFVETGFTASLLRGSRMQTQAGLFVVSGDIEFRYDRRLDAAFALFVLDGEDVELLHESAQRFIAIQSGSFSLSGFSVVLHLRSLRALPEDIVKIHRTDNVLRVARSSATLRVAPD